MLKCVSLHTQKQGGKHKVFEGPIAQLVRVADS